MRAKKLVAPNSNLKPLCPCYRQIISLNKISSYLFVGYSKNIQQCDKVGSGCIIFKINVGFQSKYDPINWAMPLARLLKKEL